MPPVSNNVFGQFATVTPLTMKSPDQFRTEGPPASTSAQYAAEFNEVKALGAQSGSSRTAAQTLLAGFATANPLFYMNAGLRDIAAAKGLSTTEQALLFVKTSMASADALIGCFNNKAVWSTWRPQTAIREAANDGNPATSPDAELAVALRDAGLPGQPVRLQLLHGRLLAQRPALLRDRQVRVLSSRAPACRRIAAVGQPRRGRRVHPDLHAVHRRDR